MNTTENNKLIAEFMGGIEFNINKAVWQKVTIGSVRTIGKNLLYHTSWDWLMPVVEKIESLLNEYFERYIEVFIEGNSCKICHVNGYHFASIHSISKLEATYFAVLKFIKWYNNHGK